jgi:hypothetical protein
MNAQLFTPNRTMAATACVCACLFAGLLWLIWSISRHPAAFYADPQAVAATEPPPVVDPEAADALEAKSKPVEETPQIDNPVAEKAAEPPPKPASNDAARAAARKAAHARAAQKAAERARARRNTFDQDAPRGGGRSRGDFISDILNAFE